MLLKFQFHGSMDSIFYAQLVPDCFLLHFFFFFFFFFKFLYLFIFLPNSFLSTLKVAYISGSKVA